MADKYQELVNGGPLTGVAKTLGLPQPPYLRRHKPGAGLLGANDRVLVTGSGPDADAIAEQLAAWELNVRRDSAADKKVGAIVVVLTEAARPTDLQGPVLAAAKHLRKLDKGGRVVFVSRAKSGDIADAALNAVRSGVEGIVRSLGHEVRGGATANGVLIADGVDVTAPSAVASLRFLLSGRSAFIDGQFLTVGSAAGELPEDWDRPLAGKVAAITGSARGIGAAIARQMSSLGAKVIVIDVPAAGEALATVANEVDGLALQQDITAADAGTVIADAAVQRYGRLDIVVHNAGITRDKMLANMDEAKWGAVIAVNIESQLRMNEQLLAHPAFAESPRIAALASTSGIAGNRGQTNYAAAKAGVIGMVESLAATFAERGGNINAVAPGFIETEMTAAVPFVNRQVARRVNSLQQGGLPLDVANAIAFLVSDQALGVNGEVLRVCGQNIVGK
ncbi:3-ketoacyl-ACP reductase [Corynebacterium sphenisci DSM 44792]|uniref:3-ketoacyl-ACP reductase n=1 Tax=Corynebacterium sphenisci DSM 44792 TaxID=1437874 RepID=A0A1L7CZP7_9CORY|nr:3-oxoacyl-ACP reductase [Corynebacterium sphenisci]APT91307.1 3-ketoacyl-ACP reductase [Corynebacterium sphenisci DSM 44792]